MLDALLAVPRRLLLACLAVGLLAGIGVEALAVSEASDRVATTADRVVLVVRNQLEQLELVARAAGVARARTLSLREWEDAVDVLGFSPPLPGVVALNSLAVVDRARLDAFAQSLRESAGPGVQVVSRTGEDILVVIDRAAPLEANRDAIGFDVLSNPDAAVGARRAVESGVASMSDVLTLVQDPQGPPAVVIYTPVPSPGRDRLGSVVVRGQEFVDAVTAELGGPTLRVVDLDTDDGRQLLGESTRHDGAAATRQLDVLGQRWEITVGVPTAASTADRIAGPATALGVALLLALLATVLTVARTREEDARRLVEARTSELRRSNAELVSAMAARDRFLAVVSHELRTPLTVIKGFAATLLDGRLDARGRALALERIDRQAARLEGLIDDVLMAAKLQEDAEEARPELVDLGPLLADLLREVPGLGRTALDVPRPVVAHADRDHVLRIVENLLTNAAKYGAPPVEVHLRSEGDVAVVEVRDHGPGIPQELRDTVFERFRQAHEDDSRSGRGVGLGLSIVRDLAEVNGGSVALLDDDGARFEVRLPLATDDQRRGAGR